MSWIDVVISWMFGDHEPCEDLKKCPLATASKEEQIGCHDHGIGKHHHEPE